MLTTSTPISVCITSLLLISSVNSFEVALFASTGCYSHDVMIREVGEQFNGQNVTWLQAYLFEFGFGEMKIPENWGRVQVSRTFNNGKKIFESNFLFFRLQLTIFNLFYEFSTIF